MPSRDHTFAFALAASLLVHVAVVFVVADDALRFARQQRTSVTTGAPTPADEEIAYIIRPPRPPRVEELLFGEADGTGDGLHDRAGAEPMVGREGGQTQAFLSRDPVGPGEIPKEPSMSVLPSGSAANSAVALASPPPVPSPPRVPFGMVNREQRWPAPHAPRAAERFRAAAAAESDESRTPDRSAPPAPAAPPESTSAKPSASEPAPAAPTDHAPGKPGAPRPAADPAVMSDSESDPFTKSDQKDDAVELRDGRVVARFGRKVKTVRPHLSFASQLDLMGMQFPRMVVRVHVHGDGTVRRVDIVKSSGSSSADQEVKVAIYQWWFEPTKQEVVEFPITWR